uniref:NACHT domain-containing protein n=1 Tax=Nocardia noduli TaxID=2815722 RepID=UPI001C2355FE
MVDPNTISTRAELVTAIAEIVKRGGRSYADVAADSGVGVATVHAMANGTSFPRWTSLEPLLLTLCELTSHELDAWRGAHGRARANAAKDSRQSRDSDTVHPGRPASIEADVVRDNSPPEPPGEARAAAAPAGMAARTAPSRASAKFAAPNPTLEQLAEEIRLRLQHAEESLAVELPDALPVRWDEVAERAGDAWANIQRSRRTSPGALVHAAPIDLGGELKDILEVYKKVPSGRLVILGAGGQGKSVLAIRLSLDMLAEREQGDDVPVIIDLGAWRGDIPVNTWIRDQIIHHFPQMDDHAVAGLIDDRRILPVLDGFDQIAQDLRAAAMEALNVTPRRPMVLTCRTNSYPPNPGALLKNAAAIELQFLSCDEVADYLDTIGSEWETVTTTIRDQRGDCAVMNVLATPLMLFLARSVFGTSTGHGQDQSTAPARILDGRFADESVLRAHLLEGFVPSKFPIRHRRAADTTSGTQHWDRRPDLVPGWLGFLAAHAEATQTIAWWQLVDSVPRWFRVCVYVVLSAGLGLVATGPILGWDAALLITTVGAAVAGVYGWWHVGEPPYRVELAFGVRDRRFQQEALLGLPFGFCAAISGWVLVGSGGWRWLLLPIAGLVGGTVRAAVGAWWLGREKPFVSELVVIG